MKKEQPGKAFNEPLNKWLRECLETHGPEKNASKLAEALGIAKMTISSMKDGKNEVGIQYVSDMAKYFGVLPPLFGVGFYPSPVMGVMKAGDGAWIEGGTQPTGMTIPTSLSLEYPEAEFVSYILDCDSMSDRFLRGDMCTFYKFSEKLYKLNTGRFVVIERDRLGLKETSMRVVTVHDDRKEFHVLNPAGGAKPVIVPNRNQKSNGEKVTVIGILHEMTRNSRKLA